jgi:hypothetical protein
MRKEQKMEKLNVLFGLTLCSCGIGLSVFAENGVSAEEIEKHNARMGQEEQNHT